MASQYWKFQLGGVTPAKWVQIQTIILSWPSGSQLYVLQYNGSAALTIGFGGENVDATKAFIQNSIITPLGLLTSSNQAIAVGVLCKTASDVAAGK